MNTNSRGLIFVTFNTAIGTGFVVEKQIGIDPILLYKDWIDVRICTSEHQVEGEEK